MKQFLIGLICLIAGIIAGYFVIPHPLQFDFTNKSIDALTLDKLSNNPAVIKRVLNNHKYAFEFSETPIKKEEAMGLIKGFRDQNQNDLDQGGGMLGRAIAAGSSTQELGGFVISRKSIDHIYANDGTETCTGLRIYLAKRPGTGPTSRLFTFIVVGTKESGGKTTGGDIETPIYEHVDPCPKNCGQLHP